MKLLRRPVDTAVAWPDERADQLAAQVEVLTNALLNVRTKTAAAVADVGAHHCQHCDTREGARDWLAAIGLVAERATKEVTR